MKNRRAKNREYFKGTWEEGRAFSRAVKTTGRTTIYLAGVGCWEDERGSSLAGDFDSQVRVSFRKIKSTLEQAGGDLTSIVTMTVFVVDMANGTRFTQLRREILGEDFPASALIGVKALARPEMMVEIQTIAVIN
jgi:enamine deaminase RidA (YjgF/YER057c/UK114 family)